MRIESGSVWLRSDFRRLRFTICASVVLALVPCIAIAGSIPIDHFQILGPLSVQVNSPFMLTVTAFDSMGVLTSYTGTIHFITTDTSPSVILPSDYTFTSFDAGVHSFSAALDTPPSQSITVSDTAVSSATGTLRVNVTTPEPGTLPMVLASFRSDLVRSTASQVTLVIFMSQVSTFHDLAESS